MKSIVFGSDDRSPAAISGGLIWGLREGLGKPYWAQRLYPDVQRFIDTDNVTWGWLAGVNAGTRQEDFIEVVWAIPPDYEEYAVYQEVADEDILEMWSGVAEYAGGVV